MTVLASGIELFEGNIRSFDGAFTELIRKSQKEIHLASYYITPESSIFRELERAIQRNVKVIVVVNRFNEQNPETQAFFCKNLKSGNLYIFSFEREDAIMHAKVLVSDRKSAIVGSANLSRHGFYINYEIGTIVNGSDAWKIAKLVERIASISVPANCRIR